MVIDFDTICIVRLRAGQTIENFCLQLITLSLRERGIEYCMNIIQMAQYRVVLFVRSCMSVDI